MRLEECLNGGSQVQGVGANKFRLKLNIIFLF